MPSMPKKRHVTEHEVCKRWELLGYMEKMEVLRFDDPILVDHVQASIVSIYTGEQRLQNMGLRSYGSYVFLRSTLLNDAFHVSFQPSKTSQSEDKRPGAALRAVLVVTDTFLNAHDVFEKCRLVLPD